MKAELRSDQFTIANLEERLKALKADPWAGYHTLRQNLTRSRRQAVGID